MCKNLKLNLDTFSQNTLLNFAKKIVVAGEISFYNLALNQIEINTNDLTFLSNLNYLNQYLLIQNNLNKDELAGLIQNVINSSQRELVNNVFTNNVNNEINYLRKVGEKGYGKNNFKEFSI